MTNLQALNAVRAIPNITEAEAQFVTAVARGESGFGSGWEHPSERTLSESEALGLTGFEGSGSNNWGAVHGVGPAGSFPHVDHRTDRTPYLAQFRKYNTATEGASDVAKIVLKPNVKAAIAIGSLKDSVEAMRANGYFEATLEEYFAMVRNNYKAIIKSTGIAPLLYENGSGSIVVTGAPIAGVTQSKLPLSFGSQQSELELLSTEEVDTLHDSFTSPLFMKDSHGEA